MAKGGKLKLVKWHLGEEELAKLEQLKNETGTSMAEHTRRAINLYFDSVTKPAEAEPVAVRRPGPPPMEEVILEREGNVLLLGASQFGKTWAMKPWIAQSVRDGECVIVLDTCIGTEQLECALQAAYEHGRGDDVFFFDTVPEKEDIEACFAQGSSPVALYHFENTFVLHTEHFPQMLDYILHEFIQRVKEFASRSDKRVHLFIDEAHRVLYPEMIDFLKSCQGSNIRAYVSIPTVEAAVFRVDDQAAESLLGSFETKYFFRPASPRSLEFARKELIAAGLAEQRTRPLLTLRPQVFFVVAGGSAKAGKVPQMQPLRITMGGTIFRGSHTPYPLSVVDLPSLCQTLREKDL